MRGRDSLAAGGSDHLWITGRQTEVEVSPAPYLQVAIPAVPGVWLALARFAWVIVSLTSTLLPQYQDRVNSYLQPAIIGEIVFMLWLLIKGAKPQVPDAAAA